MDIEYFKKEWPETYGLKWFSDKEMVTNYLSKRSSKYGSDEIPLACLLHDYNRLYGGCPDKDDFKWWVNEFYTKIE